MKLVAEQNKGSRKTEIFELSSGKYEVYCSVAGNASRAFPSREYVNYKAAIRRADNFLEA